jgi:hypothetical protein
MTPEQKNTARYYADSGQKDELRRYFQQIKQEEFERAKQERFKKAYPPEFTPPPRPTELQPGQGIYTPPPAPPAPSGFFSNVRQSVNRAIAQNPMFPGQQIDSSYGSGYVPAPATPQNMDLPFLQAQYDELRSYQKSAFDSMNLNERQALHQEISQASRDLNRAKGMAMKAEKMASRKMPQKSLMSYGYLV